ncbi:MAG: nicotinamide mononucleotide transporter [Clostridia bacterium]|nr:nicotinamide mononucleotide transporter [Clostridia bacterium]
MYFIRKIRSLSGFERGLWLFSLIGVTLSSVFSPVFDPLSLTASLIGVTALIFVAKGDPLGQVLTVVFSVFYGIIAWTFRYYGEMITYLGMSAPMAALAVISWVRNPYEQGKAEVRVNRLKLPEVLFLAALTILVTVLFYFILAFFGTANLLPSTLSVTTSFLASYLTFRRSPFYALAYAANDLVLIALWILAALEDPSYLPMILCFAMFFLNDTYGFINWQRMQKRQKI